MHHGKLIEALGGYKVVAQALNCHRSRTHRWKSNGIPVARWPAILKLAKTKSLRLTANDLLRHAPDNGIAVSATATHQPASLHSNAVEAPR